MYQGFYNLASGMLTQNRNLNVISNNMVNVQTPGYKRDTMVSSTFQEEMLYRTGRYNKDNPIALAVTSKIKTASQTYVNYEQGSYEQTDGLYDFALGGSGFFCIQTPEGERYTRNGSFSVDEEGYLISNEMGRVLSADNQPIQIDGETFAVDQSGVLTVTDTTGEIRRLGQIKIVDFADYNQLVKEDYGVFSTGQAPLPMNQTQETAAEEPQVLWKTLEKSNVDMLNEMTSMMASQRALQSAAQMLKMYDTVMSKSASDIGRL